MGPSPVNKDKEEREKQSCALLSGLRGKARRGEFFSLPFRACLPQEEKKKKNGWQAENDGLGLKFAEERKGEVKRG